MDVIHLQQVLPQVFAEYNTISSDIWHHDLYFQRGKRYLLEAASGTGKSSLCAYIYGYRDDYQGIINFDEQNIKSLRPKEWDRIRRMSLSLLFQDLRLFPELTALENVQLKNRLTRHKSKKQILQLFEALGLSDKLHQRVQTLSFGQQQRVAFIRCLCQPFQFILLDEPVSHLDAANAQVMAQLLLEEAQAQQAGVLVTSIGKHLEMDYDLVFNL